MRLVSAGVDRLPVKNGHAVDLYGDLIGIQIGTRYGFQIKVLVDPSPEGAETSRTLLDVLGEKIPEALNAANGGTAPRSPCEICKGKIEFMKRRLNGGFTNFFV